MAPHTTSRFLPSLPSSLLSLSTLSTLLLTIPSPAAAFSCKEIAAQGVHFNLEALDGPRTVQWEQEPDWENQRQFKYNFTLNLCNKLERPKGSKAEEECRSGTRICAKQEEVYLSGDHNSTITPIEIAGTYAMDDGRKIDAKFQLLRNSNSNSDAGREGVRAELHGGRFPYDDKKTGIDQRAIIEFVCDKDRTGLEDGTDDGEKKPDGDKDGKDDKKEGDKDGEKKEGKLLRVREGESKCEDNDKSLRFCGYHLDNLPKDKKVKTLRLEWRTKYACENAPNDSASSHWGFFTWFIIILFLATAAYLIFGSWLNYNRYGARGWDLLPHGDTIRDVPYILKDWARNVKNTLSGPGSRGGYSAV